MDVEAEVVVGMGDAVGDMVVVVVEEEEMVEEVIRVEVLILIFEFWFYEF